MSRLIEALHIQEFEPEYYYINIASIAIYMIYKLQSKFKRDHDNRSDKIGNFDPIDHTQVVKNIDINDDKFKQI